VRELTHSVIKKAELLPNGETIEQHIKEQKIQADIIQQDRNNPESRNGGLWKGFFRRVGPRIPRPALRDVEDGVDRCPYCQWELEDGMCQRCGLPFDENGTGTWDFSDGLSERSEQGLPSEMGSELDVDVEIDMDDDGEIDEFENEDEEEEAIEAWYREHGPMAPIPLQRFLEHGHGYAIPYETRPAAHSAAHSRRRSSYSASIVSDMPGSEMGTVEEEDEEDEDDSSMSGFIEPDERPLSISGSASSSTYASSSRPSVEPDIIEEDEDEEDADATEDEGPVRSGRRRRIVTESSSPVANSGPQSTSRSVSELTDDSQPIIRNRRVISETLPSASATAAETEAEEEEDEGPLPVRRRRRRDTTGDQTRRVRRRQRGSSVESSAASNAASVELRDPDSLGYRRLHGQQTNEDEEFEGGDESDGGRTTVGWEPITNSNERNRNTGSLTPTADRPNALRRPLSRTGSSRNPPNIRGLRRRGSTISSNDHYEDNDADDDVSETDHDGDTDMIRPNLRQQNSRVLLRHTVSRPLLSRAHPVLANQDNESDDTDLSSQSAQHEQLIRQREYDPTIGNLFAQHQTNLRVEDIDSRPAFSEFEHLRTLARTPVARPRTGNRNRIAGYPVMPSPGPISRATPPAHNISRYRNSIESSPNMLTAAPRPIFDRSNSSSSRTSLHSTTTAHTDGPIPVLTPPSDTTTPSASSSISTMRSRTVSQTMSPMHNARVGDSIERPASRLPAARAGDGIERPASRVTSRPPSASGRRGSAGRMPFSAPPPLSPMGPGLNTARIWQYNNPFLNARAAGIRPRQSSQRLREQSSTATLRARDSTRTLRQPPSVVNIRDATDQSPIRPRSSNRGLRQPPSVVNIRDATDQSPLRPRSSNRGLRQPPSVVNIRDAIDQPPLRPHDSDHRLRQLPSQINIREEADQSPPQVRPQASRLHLRPQPSYRRLAQAQIIMREAALAQMHDPNQPESSNGQRYSPNTIPTLSEDERRRRASELVRRRALELAEERINERNNPFQRRARQDELPTSTLLNTSNALNALQGNRPPPPNASNAPNAPHGNRVPPGNAVMPNSPQQPTLGRRRSNRGLTSPNGFAPASVFHSANTGSIRARLGAIQGRPYESHVPTGMARGISALTAGGDFRLN
jgi:hypothetical protein